VYQAVYPLNSERVTGETAGDLTVDCKIKSTQSLKAVYSPTHEIQVKRESDHEARVTFEGKDVRANRDFIIYYTISEKAFGLNALAHRRPGEDGYVMLMLAPKYEVSSSDVQPKDVVVVFDTSGSMQGAKIEQARKALQTILGALNERDRFNVIRFSSDVTNFRPSVVAANPENRAAARAFVDEFKAVGGTAIDDALQAGLASIPKAEERAGRAPFLIFMTDGLPTIGVTEIDKILKNADTATPKDLRVFTFGVGADVNTLLLDHLATDHRGAADYISQNEDLEAKIGSFYNKISDPVLSNVQVAVTGAALAEVYPKQVPDVFAGTQLLILGRYKGQGKVTVSLAGELNGKPQKYSYDLNLPERELSQDFIPKLWASRKIGFFLEQIRLTGENKELKDEVIRLSKEFGIVTPYTAYLVEEPGLAPPVTGRPELFFGAARDEDARLGVALKDGRAAGGRGGLGGGGFGGGLEGQSRIPVDSLGRAIKDNPPLKKLGESRGRAATAPVAGKPAAPAGPTGPQGLTGPRGPAGPPGPSGVVRESLAERSKAAPGAAPAGGTLARLPKITGAVSIPFRAAELDKAKREEAGFKQSTGAYAVDASRRLRELKDKEVTESEVGVGRTIEGRAFRYSEDGRWTDQTATEKTLKVVPVKYGSDAYFRLVAVKPEWARFLSAGRQVTFRTGKTTVVAVGEKGKEKLTDVELKALEK
jgi:Ca-activated chloride channel family protein